MNNKGLYMQIRIVIVMGMVLGGLIIFFFAASLLFPILSDAGNELNNAFQGSVIETNDTGLIVASQASFGSANSVLQQSEWIVYTMFIMLFLTFLLLAFYVRTYPFLVFFWIAIILILVFVSLFLSISYGSLIADAGSLTTTYTSWSNSHYMLLYLPHMVSVMGVIGGIIMYVLATKDPEAEAMPI